jgi:hypothetical protein
VQHPKLVIAEGEAEIVRHPSAAGRVILRKAIPIL